MAQNLEEIRKEKSRLFPRLKSVRYGRHQASSGAFKEAFNNGKGFILFRIALEQKKRTFILYNYFICLYKS
ncbi:hypothetical protein SAMN04487931_10824 [Desulfobacula phenolica]|uniref:Uncharacterized protein n=1 Tax=Desulfobacula phenolica TaxID=90732 RepID=A0A1H2IA75_9BACT|nr:hypothetical protein SAMN04487931_10824 [Desulfobacula phenolica]